MITQDPKLQLSYANTCQWTHTNFMFGFIIYDKQ